jgi:mRNA-degrading endonuclease RelE of RelBE toxin-antitoxin system
VQVKAYQKFKEYYLELPSTVRKKIDKQIRLLAVNFRHPSLQCKKMQGWEGVWEARVDEKYRMTFEIVGDTIFLRVVGNHDEALRSP